MSGWGGAIRILAETGGLLACGVALLAAARGLASLAGARTRPSTWLRTSRLLVVSSLLLPLLLRVLPPRAVASLSPGPSIPAARRAASLLAPSSIGLVRKPAAPSSPVGAGLAVVLVAGASLRLASAWRDRRRMAGHLRGLPVIRRRGRVILAACSLTASPYAVWSRGRAWVVVPTGLLAHGPRLRWLVAHELHHHRQGDTSWAHAWQVIEALQFWNPAVYLWRRLLGRLQELACDEAVASHPAITPAAYARHLLWAASAAGARRFRISGAALSAASSPTLLRRRIEMLLDERLPRRTPVVASGAACLAALVAVAAAAQSDLAARRLQEQEVRDLARSATGQGGFEVPVNEVVVRELNALLESGEMRRAMRDALSRMTDHREMIDRTLERHGLPPGLKAIPLLESRFRNLQEAAPTADYPGPRGAGLWQFIAPTARKYGLRVDGRVDERLDPTRETEAAARYLSRLHGEFGDWGLALAAYNQGESAVRQAVDQSGTRDAWELIRQGQINTYAGSIMAGVLLIAHPDLVRAP